MNGVEIMLAIMLLGVAMIDAKLWKLVSEQKRHNKAMELLLQSQRQPLAVSVDDPKLAPQSRSRAQSLTYPEHKK